MKPITILSGPIGAGKTTVARELVAALPGPLVSIEGDSFWPFIVKPAAGVSRNRNFKTIMKAMTLAALGFALDDYAVVLDFSIPPWFLNTARAIVIKKNVPLDYVALRPSESICAARAAARTEGAIADYSLYHDLYACFDEAERYIIRDDESSPAAVAAIIRDGLDAGRFRVG